MQEAIDCLEDKTWSKPKTQRRMRVRSESAALNDMKVRPRDWEHKIFIETFCARSVLSLNEWR